MRPKYSFAVVLLLIVVAGGCSPKPAMSPEQATPLPLSASGPPIGIGDVEAYVKVEGTLSPASYSEFNKVEELRNPRGILSLTTIRVAPPHPEKLWLNIALRPERPFAERPVAIRGVVYRQAGDGPDENIGSFNTIIGRYVGRFSPEAVEVPQSKFEFDVLKGLPDVPITMLVHARVEALLMLEGTDEAKIDPRTATVAPTDSATLLSNPVRIEFDLTAGHQVGR